MDTLMVRSSEQLGDQIIRRPNKPLALHLAHHLVRQAFRHLLQTSLNLRFPLCFVLLIHSISIAEQALFLFYNQSLTCQFAYLCMQHWRCHDGCLDVVREALVEYRLTYNVVVASPARPGNMQAHLAEEVKGRFAEPSHVLNQIAITSFILTSGGCVTVWEDCDLVSDDRRVWRPRKWALSGRHVDSGSRLSRLSPQLTGIADEGVHADLLGRGISYLLVEVSS